jgi:hypothetical protein
VVSACGKVGDQTGFGSSTQNLEVVIEGATHSRADIERLRDSM